MERALFTFSLFAGKEVEYQRRHDEIWPDLVADIKSAGISNYSLFRRGSDIFAYCECEPDVTTCFERLSHSEANKRWAVWFEEVIESLTDESGSLRFTDEVWHLP